MISYALDNLDIKMRHYLSEDNGIYIECGANDGVTQSNTFAYEKLGWTGLLVEPCPSNYILCQKNRPNSIVENYALVSFDYDKSTISGFFNNSCYNGLMAPLNHFPSSYDQERIDSHKEFVNKFNLKAIDVPCCTLQYLLDKHNIKHVDFFSLDVEGYEIEVLSGMALRPKYILIEVTESINNQQKINAYMQDKQYEFVEQLSINDALYKDKTI